MNNIKLRVTKLSMIEIRSFNVCFVWIITLHNRTKVYKSLNSILGERIEKS